jgi:hypothetical protein
MGKTPVGFFALLFLNQLQKQEPLRVQWLPEQGTLIFSTLFYTDLWT